jgi:hypothetical protein
MATAEERPMSLSLPFKTADEAAVAALLEILPKSIKQLHEYGGYIYKIDGKFYYNKPMEMTSDPDGGTYPAPRPPARAKLVAQIHTHPFNEDKYGVEGDLSTIVKPDRFSKDRDVPGRRAFEAAWQSTSPGPIDMYVIDIHGEVSVLQGKRGSQPEKERQVRDCGDLTCI